MHADSFSTSTAPSLSLRRRTSGNHFHANVNAVAEVNGSFSYPSLPLPETAAPAEAPLPGSHSIHPGPIQEGEGRTPVQHNLRPTHAHSRAPDVLDRVAPPGHSADLLSPMLASGHTAATADGSAASLHASVAPTAGSEDSAPPDAKSQLLQSLHIHSPTSPTTAVLPNNETTAQNASRGMPPPHTPLSPVITDSSSSPTTGIKMRVYSTSALLHPQPSEGCFLAAVAPAKDQPVDGVACPAAEAKAGKSDGWRRCSDLSSQGSPISTAPGSGKEHAPLPDPRASRTSTPSSTAASSISSVPHSHAETQCLAGGNGKGHDGEPCDRLPLPATFGPLAAASSVSSFTVSTASATASPHPTSNDAVTTHEEAPSSSSPPSTAALSKTAVVLLGREETAEVGDSGNSGSTLADSPLISLANSKTGQSSGPLTSSHPSASRPSSTDFGGGGRGRSRAKPRHRNASFTPATTTTTTATATNTASERDKMPLQQTKVSATPPSSRDSGATTNTNAPSSQYSTVTLESAFTGPRGPNLVGMRITSPDAQPAPYADAPRPRPGAAGWQDSCGSLFSGGVAPLTFFAPLPTGAANGFAQPDSFRLPAFMSTSTASLVSFPRIDAPLRAATTTAASPLASVSGRADNAVATGHAEPAPRPQQPSMPLPVRFTAPLQVDHASSTATTDETPDSHFQLSSDGRTIENSSFHSPSLPQQGSRAFTVTSTSFAFDGLSSAAAAATTPRTHTRARSGMYDSVTSFYRSSSLLSDTVLQTLAHGMALGGGLAAPWRSVAADAAAPVPNIFGVSYCTDADADASLYAARSDNRGVVRHPSAMRHHPGPTRNASQVMQTSTAAGTVLFLHDSSLTDASSCLYGVSLTGQDGLVGSGGPHSFLSSPRGASTARPSPALDNRGVPPRLQQSQGSRHVGHSSVTFTPPSRARPATATATARATPPPLPANAPRPPPPPPISGSFFAADNDAPRWTRTRACDYPVLHRSTSLMTPHTPWHSSASAMARSTAAAVCGGDEGLGGRSPTSSSVPMRSGQRERSRAPTSSALSGALSENSIFVLYGTRSATDSEGERSRQDSRKSAAVVAEPVALRRRSALSDRGSAVAQGRVPSSGFSAAADSTAPPAAPLETPLDVHATFLQSVHAATVNAVGAPHSCSSALRHFLMSGSSPAFTASVPLYSCSLTASAGGRGVFCGDAHSADPSMLQPSPSDSGKEGTFAVTSSTANHDGDGSPLHAAMAAAPPPPPMPKRLADGEGEPRALDISSSLTVSSRVTPLLPQPLRTSASLSDAGGDARDVGRSEARGFGDGMSNPLPFAEREHASVSGSCRLPTLHLLGSSAYQCRAERSGERMATSRHLAGQGVARRKRGSLPTPISTASTSCSATTEEGVWGSPHAMRRSKPFASSYNAAAVPPPRRPSQQQQHDADAGDDAMDGTKETPLGVRQAAVRGSGPTPSHSHSPQSGCIGASHPYSTTASRGLLASDLTQRSSRQPGNAERRGPAREAENDAVDAAASADAHNAAAIAVTPAAAAAGEFQVRGGPLMGRIAIPAFHRHRDLESMLDDAESLLRRSPVPIITVLGSKLRRRFDPGLSGSLGQSGSCTGTSVMSLQTTAPTASISEPDSRRISETTETSSEKKPLSRAATDMSITISSVPFAMQETQ